MHYTNLIYRANLTPENAIKRINAIKTKKQKQNKTKTKQKQKQKN